jgi:phage recombination protein Bet
MNTDTQLAIPAQKKQLAGQALAERMQCDPNRLLTTLKGTVFKDARTDEELYALVLVANAYNLNPLTKEIYAFPAKGGGIVPVVSVDGWIRMMNDHPQFDGIEFEDKFDDKGEIVSCTAIIHRKDRTRPVKVTEYLSECVRNTEPWKMKKRMLRHKSLMQCARVAFGFSGIHDEDEAKDITGSVKEIPKAEMTASTTGTTQALPVVDAKAEVVSQEPPTKTTRTRATKPASQPEQPTETKAAPAHASEDRPPGGEPEASQSAAQTPHAQLEAKLNESGFTAETCLKMAISMQLASKTATSLLEIPPRNVTNILEDWETAVEAMELIQKQAQG